MSASPRRLLLLSPAFHGYWQSIERAFTDRGYLVTTVCYDAHSTVGDRLRAKVADELPERLGASATRRRAVQTTRAVEAVRTVDPDVVLVVKGDCLDDRFWDAVAPRRRALWLYDELRRTAHTEHSLAAAGPIASYSPGDVQTLTDRGLRAVHVPLAHDPHVPFTPRPTGDVVFVGARYPSREALLARMHVAGVPVRAHGRDWSGHPVDRVRTWRLHQPPVPHGRDLPRAEAYAVMAGARATLNVHGDQDGFTMRTFEACGVGALQLIDRGDVTQHFDTDTELAVFSSPDEAIDLAGRARADTQWADKVRRAGQARTLAEHTFAHRAAALELLWTA